MWVWFRDEFFTNPSRPTYGRTFPHKWAGRLLAEENVFISGLKFGVFVQLAPRIASDIIDSRHPEKGISERGLTIALQNKLLLLIQCDHASRNGRRTQFSEASSSCRALNAKLHAYLSRYPPSQCTESQQKSEFARPERSKQDLGIDAAPTPLGERLAHAHWMKWMRLLLCRKIVEHSGAFSHVNHL